MTMTMKHVMTLSMAVAFGTAALAQTGAAQSGTTQTAKPAAPTAAAKPTTIAALQGRWVLTSADGQDLTGAPEITLTITKDQYVQTIDGEVVERGEFKLNETKTPIQLDLMIKEGKDAGTTQLGVVEIKGTTMRGKLNTPPSPVRPTDFEPADGFFTFTAAKK
jgi:uncharacterized protein (TIGR03067 family)